MSWMGILKNTYRGDYSSIADDLINELKTFSPKLVGSVGKKESPNDIDLLFPEDTNFSKLKNKLETLGWRLRFAEEDEYNGEIKWNFEKNINKNFEYDGVFELVGLDIFFGNDLQ